MGSRLFSFNVRTDRRGVEGMVSFVAAHNALRLNRAIAQRLVGVRLCSAAIVLAVALSAPRAATANTVVVFDDPGGSVSERVEIVRRLASAGTNVEIRGSYCLSACTMYLSLTDACVAPRTIFGFHGPSSALYGIALSPAKFEKWSIVMANHYPEPIRSWYMNEGRHRTVGFHRYTGQDLIKMGISECHS